MAAEPVLRVAVPAPVRALFDYLPGADGPPLPGSRVRVPFGRTERCGVLVEVVAGEPAGRQLKRLGAVLDPEPLLSQADLELLVWAARYYQHPIGEVIASALPLRLRQGKPLMSARRERWCLTASGRELSPKLARAPRQAALAGLLATSLDGMTVAELVEAGEANAAQGLRALCARGWVERAPFADEGGTAPPAEPGPALNAPQAGAVAAVRARLDGFGTFVLDGVTGSGKTEVYLALVRAVVAAGRQALVLVPEIGLTPQVLDRFQRRSGARIAVLHSGLAEGERERAWLAARRGKADVVIGTRSAVFTPLPRLGLVVVDEEHDASFKQQEGFRYSARDLAVVRAQRAGCPAVLGSATPSLETLRNVQLGRYQTLALPQRAGTAAAPQLGLVDIRAVPLQAGLGPVSRRMVQEALGRGEQVLLFLNRRGYAPVVMCHACGWVAGCRRCDARLTLHAADGLLWCHHCGSQRSRDHHCPECGSPELVDVGLGTERLEEQIAALFEGYAVMRVDRDSTRRKGALERSIEGIRSGRFPLLVGTQMLAKGHHFPNLTLVVVLDADQGLYGVDFRAAERMAQLIEQVAGRAGRADKAGSVLVQTRHPDHPLLQLLVQRGYAGFAAAALAEREAAGLPPFGYQVLWRAEAVRPEPPRAFLCALADLVRAQAGPGVEVWGPVPAPMERRAGRHRAHLLVQARERGPLHGRLEGWVERAAGLPEASRVRWTVDVDPLDAL